MVGDSIVQKGEYEIFTKPNRDSWNVYFYKDNVNWDVPEKWEEDKVAAKINVPSMLSSRQASSLNITMENLTNKGFELIIHWDKTYVAIPIGLTTVKIMKETIEDVLAGPDADDYYLAALYHLEAETNLEEALSWIQEAIEIRPKSVYWDYTIQSKILLLLGRNAEVIRSSEKGLELAKARPSEYGINEHNGLLAKARN